MNALQQVEVQLVNGRPMVSSLKVAEHFEKRHKNVIQAIERLEIPEDFRRLNFQPSSYVNSQNKKQPMYLMTRDGFVLLAMGFTGKKAMQWKIRYIEAFNAMERRLMEQATVNRDILSGVSKIVENLYRQLVRDMEIRVEQGINKALAPLKAQICAVRKLLIPSYPFRVLRYKNKFVRFLIKKDQLVLYAPDYVRELTGESFFSSTPYLLKKIWIY